MGIFSKDNEKASTVSTGGATKAPEAGQGTAISNYTLIKGEIEAEETLDIDGRFEGELRSTGEVYIGEDGKVAGNINAVEVVVFGEVTGTIIADRVEIGETGVVKAEIVSEFLTIQDGGVFEGKKKMKVNLMSFEEEKAKTETKEEESKTETATADQNNQYNFKQNEYDSESK